MKGDLLRDLAGKPAWITYVATGRTYAESRLTRIRAVADGWVYFGDDDTWRWARLARVQSVAVLTEAAFEAEREAERRRSAEREARWAANQAEYDEKKRAHEALPWYRKLWAEPPVFRMPSNY